MQDDIKKLTRSDLEVQPLTFMSGKFNGTQKKWHISQRELYPIVHAFHRFAFLLKNPSKTVNIVTDHAALKYILDPTIAKNKSHSERLSRWALTIQAVRTRIFHNPGKDHQFADLLSRWGYARVDLRQKTNETALPEARHERGYKDDDNDKKDTKQDEHCVKRDKPSNPAPLLRPDQPISNKQEKKGVVASLERNWNTNEQAFEVLRTLNDIIDFETDYIMVNEAYVNILVEESLPWIQEEELGYELRQLPENVLKAMTFYDSKGARSAENLSIYPFQMLEETKGASRDTNQISDPFIETDNSDSTPLSDLLAAKEVTNRQQIEANGMTLRRKLRLEKFSEELGDAFKKDDISFYNPYYEGDYFMLSQDVLLDFQVQDGYIDQSEINLCRDEKGRIMMKEHRLAHLIIGIHVQNNHVGVEQDLRVLRRFHVEGKAIAELNEIMINYRHLCLHCARYPHLLRIPLNKTLIGRKPRAVLRMDYLSVNKAGHLLVIIDTFSRKTFLKHTMKEDAFSAAEGLLEWHAHYVLSEHFILITDNGSHFANELMKELVPKLRGRHEFSVPFAPWTNGSCENRNRMILRILRQLCSELGLTTNEWPNFIPMVMGVINNLPIPSRKGMTANQLFLGTTTNPTLFPQCKMIDKRTVLKQPNEKIEELIDSLQREWLRTHEQEKVYDHLDLARELNNQRRNKTLSVLQFKPGDWVLYSTVGRPNRINKLQPIWVGPLRVKDTLGKNVYHLEDVFGKKYVVHASRLYFYNTEKYVPEEYVQKMYRQHWTGLELDRIHGIAQDEKGYITVGVVWYGFPNDEPEWLPLENVLDGAHLLLNKFIADNKRTMDPALHREISRKVKDRVAILEAKSLEIGGKEAGTPNPTPLHYLKGPETGNTDQVQVNNASRLIEPNEDKGASTPNVNPFGADKNTTDPLLDDVTERIGLAILSKQAEPIKGQADILVSISQPTYLRGWTAQELTTLKDWLRVQPCGQWQAMLPFFPARNKSQIICKVQRLLNTQDLRKFNGKLLTSEFGPPKKGSSDILPTLNRDLRKTRTFVNAVKRAELILATFKGAISEAIDDERGSFRGEPLIELMPNYYRWNNMVYRHIPAGALWKKAKVEDVKWTEGIIDLLYMDPPWKLNCADPTRGPLLDYGK